MPDIETDLLIIGAGPSGLYATYYAGFRGLRVALVDSLPELGGQVTAIDGRMVTVEQQVEVVGDRPRIVVAPAGAVVELST